MSSPEANFLSRLFRRGAGNDIEADAQVFASRFGAFLRNHPELWRARRSDQLLPIDVALAQRTIRIQGVITRQALDEFFRATGERTRDIIEERGVDLSVYIPVLRRPKRLLLDQTVRDASRRNLPTLTRSHDSAVVAAALLQLLPFEVSDEQLPMLEPLLAAMASSNPFDLTLEVKRWADARGYPFGFNRPLADTAHLFEW